MVMQVKGADIRGLGFVVELDALKGRDKLRGMTSSRYYTTMADRTFPPATTTPAVMAGVVVAARVSGFI